MQILPYADTTSQNQKRAEIRREDMGFEFKMNEKTKIRIWNVFCFIITIALIYAVYVGVKIAIEITPMILNGNCSCIK